MLTIKTNPNPTAPQIQEVIVNTIYTKVPHKLYIENESTHKAELIQESDTFRNWIQEHICSKDSSETVLYIEDDSDLLIPFATTYEEFISDQDADELYTFLHYTLENHKITLAIN